MWISFEDMKIDCPNVTAKYIIARKTGGQTHKSPLKWAENHIRSVRRMIAKIAETYRTIGYTECWGHEPPHSDQDAHQEKDHTIRRTSKKRKKLLSNHLF